MKMRGQGKSVIPVLLVAGTVGVSQPASGGLSIRDLGTLGGPASGAQGINDRGEVVGFSATFAGEAASFLWKGGAMIELAPGFLFIASDINNRGQVVGGGVTAAGENHAFVLEAGTMTDLGTLNGIESGAFDINERGQVVGIGATPSGDVHAVLWAR